MVNRGAHIADVVLCVLVIYASSLQYTSRYQNGVQPLNGSD